MSPLDQRLSAVLAQIRAQNLHRVRRVVEGLFEELEKAIARPRA